MTPETKEVRKELSENQQAYYDERVAYFKSIRSSGRKVAVPYGLIYDHAIKMTDKEIEDWFKE